MNSASNHIVNSLNCATASFATSALSGAPSGSAGSLFNVKGATFTDTATSSGSSTANFAASYIAPPTLAASNANVTTVNASTVTIAGPPTAGTNQTITNAYALNVASGPSYFGGNVTMAGTLPYLYANQPYGAFSMNMSNVNGTAQVFQFTYTSGNIGTGVTTASAGIPITVTGLYAISHGFEANSIVEYVLYLNTSANANRIINRYNNAATFPDTRHSYATVALIQAGTTVGAYVTTSGSTSIQNVYSKGLVITLLTRTA